MNARKIVSIVALAILGVANASTLTFEADIPGNKGQSYISDGITFSTSASSTLYIRSDCGQLGNCLASIPNDFLYGWLAVQLPDPVYTITFDYYTSDAKLWIAGHVGSAAREAIVIEEYYEPSNWWRHVTIQSIQKFDYISFSTVTNDRFFNNRPFVLVDNVVVQSPVPEPTTAVLIVMGLALTIIRAKKPRYEHCVSHSSWAVTARH